MIKQMVTHENTDTIQHTKHNVHNINNQCDSRQARSSTCCCPCTKLLEIHDLHQPHCEHHFHTFTECATHIAHVSMLPTDANMQTPRMRDAFQYALSMPLPRASSNLVQASPYTHANVWQCCVKGKLHHHTRPDWGPYDRGITCLR